MSKSNFGKPISQVRDLRALATTLIRFAAVGVGVTASYLICALVLSRALGLDAVAASSLAYLLCIALSYGLQARVTFRVSSHGASQIGRFALTHALGLMLSVVSVRVAEGSGLSPVWGFVATSVLIPFVSFAVMLLWVFAPSQTAVVRAKSSEASEIDLSIREK